MTWQLVQVINTDWIQNDSEYYTLINWIDDNNVRLDIMDSFDMPVINFQGKANDVWKTAVRDMVRKCGMLFSQEHAAYIGAELARAELLKADYMQD